MVNQQVENGQTDEWEKVHDHKVKPCDVNTDVGGVLSHRCHMYVSHIGLNFFVVLGLPSDFEESNMRKTFFEVFEVTSLLRKAISAIPREGKFGENCY